MLHAQPPHLDPKSLEPQLRRYLDVAQAIALNIEPSATTESPKTCGQPILQAARQAILELLALHQQLQQEQDCAHATITQDGTALELATAELNALHDRLEALQRDNTTLRQQLQELQRSRLH